MEYRIIEQIEKKGFTITDFVEKMGWKQRSSFYNMMSGNPTILQLEKIASVLECNVSDLLKENDEKVIESSSRFVCPNCGAELELRKKE